MSIDLSQFYEVFIEESFEGLDAMESELLRLTPDAWDEESINTIFRAAHSIKGGSGTFGFNPIAEFTHEVETFLDEVRDKKRELNPSYIDLLLRSVDCLRMMLNAIQNNDPQESEVAKSLTQEYQSILRDTDTKTGIDTSGEATQPSSVSIWEIQFKPKPHLFRTGNEPLFILEDLAAIANIEVEVNLESLPDLKNLNPENSYLSWLITLDTKTNESAVREIFEWVEDDAEITYKLIAQFDDDDIAPIEPDESIVPKTNDTSTESNEPNSTDDAVTTPKSNNRDMAECNTQQESGSIRVATDKIDSLINMVGELVITQSILNEISDKDQLDSNQLQNLKQGLAELSHNTRDLQETVMRIRMLPINFVFARFPRLVRDISKNLGKKVEITLLGEHTELDKTVMEKISDPLVHLIRNALDHGLETPEQRVALGKNETGHVTLNAFHQGGNIIIEIIDDGRGLDTEKIRQKALDKMLIEPEQTLSEQEIAELIFLPGFSTADEVSDLSGRGVGMDVVKRNIQDLNGTIDVQTKLDQGTTFIIRLPLTLAIVDGQLIRVGQQTYIVPLVVIVESLQIDISQVNCVGGGLEVLRLREEHIPILRLHEVFQLQGAQIELAEALLVVVETDNHKVGLLVDELLAQQQFVIKSLEQNYKRVAGISGATILGNGSVALILDVFGLVQLAGLNRVGQTGLDFQIPVPEAV